VKNTINSGKDKLTDSLTKYYSLTEHMELKLLYFSKVQSFKKYTPKNTTVLV